LPGDRRESGPAHRALGLDPAAFLEENDFTGFFMGIGDLLSRGPTANHLDHFRAILVDRP
jgi:glycerate 2-kinase